jgi:hypothetical protein
VLGNSTGIGNEMEKMRGTAEILLEEVGEDVMQPYIINLNNIFIKQIFLTVTCKVLKFSWVLYIFHNKYL